MTGMEPEHCDFRNVEKIFPSQFEKKERVMAALANKNRIAILYAILKYGELCACDLSPSIGLSQPAVTLHLQKLYNAGILKKREKGKFTYFYINDDDRSIISSFILEDSIIKS
ncbi:MAG: ArsR/SmtB family transcription factor [Thermoplasmata archaeon]